MDDLGTLDALSGGLLCHSGGSMDSAAEGSMAVGAIIEGNGLETVLGIV